jgi:anti-sigma regulatory factor (Ser/Thr protein kinase)
VSVTGESQEIVTEFRHEALLYRGPDELGAVLLPIIRNGIDAGDSVLVAVDEDKAERLRGGLGDASSLVRFVDMRRIGRNPARIIPVWQSFVARHAGSGRGALGVGEPVWPGRSADELEECELHESLLNVAFSGGPAWRLVCPYDVANLSEGEIRTAFDTHPAVPRFPATADPIRLRGVPERFRTPLAEPSERHADLPFEGAGALAGLRAAVTSLALEAGLNRDRAGDMALAVSEVAANSIRHGGGRGTLMMWRSPDAFVCEVRDRGHIDDPLVGRIVPEPLADGQRGLWLVNQLCDLVQLRSLDDGVVVRLHLALPAAARAA